MPAGQRSDSESKFIEIFPSFSFRLLDVMLLQNGLLSYFTPRGNVITAIYLNNVAVPEQCNTVYNGWFTISDVFLQAVKLVPKDSLLGRRHSLLLYFLL